MTTRRPAHSSPPPTPANSRPGANGVWLDPGTCAFANREWIPGELPGVQFEVVQGASGGSGPVSIPEYLRDENQYWRFAVYRTAYGYYQATHHESWRPAASPTGLVCATSQSTCDSFAGEEDRHSRSAKATT